MFISKPQRKQILWLTFSITTGSLKPRSQTSLQDSHQCFYLILTKPICPKHSKPLPCKTFFWVPFSLKTSLEKQIIPSFDFFKNLLQSEAKALEAIKRSPVPGSNIITLLQTQPRASFVNPVLFRELVGEVKEMGFNPSTMKFAKCQGIKCVAGYEQIDMGKEGQC
ncbi:hypothetical protein CFP56_043995 [Quercus suber]|uniref:Uncharacterized protein n=1 Tax=Quercus suber TaxID=58331 RepID=A0AAW0LIA0_QUESU